MARQKQEVLVSAFVGGKDIRECLILGELSRSSNARSLTQKQSKHCQFLVECLAT